jgi:uncharacterized protein with HEPN domain
MVDACGRIRLYLEGWTLDQFERDLRTHDAVCMNLIRIGEGARLLSAEIKADESETAWRKIINMRNFIAHTYALVETGVVWRTATTDVPRLAEALARMQARLRG